MTSNLKRMFEISMTKLSHLNNFSKKIVVILLITKTGGSIDSVRRAESSNIVNHIEKQSLRAYTGTKFWKKNPRFTFPDFTFPTLKHSKQEEKERYKQKLLLKWGNQLVPGQFRMVIL